MLVLQEVGLQGVGEFGEAEVREGEGRVAGAIVQAD